MLEQRCLNIPRQLADADVLVNELLTYRVKIDTVTAHDSYNAREGQR